MEKKLNILKNIIIVLFILLIIFLFYIQVVKQEFFQINLKKLEANEVYGESSPRGRIYDRNGILIVDNKLVNQIAYKNNNNSVQEELDIALKLSEIIELDYLEVSDQSIKKFFLDSNGELCRSKITEEELQQLEERKITSEDIYNLKLERITEEEISSVNKKAAFIYNLMNDGYYYSEKVIKKAEVTDLEMAIISESELNGVFIKKTWERYYPYEETFRTVFGNIGYIPYEKKNEYLDNGYSLNDKVGTTYLEYQYEEYLKGKKDLYHLKNGKKVLLEEGSRGSDLTLTIDINLQQALEQILKEEVLKAKKEPNTSLYNKSFVVISNPNTGEILAMAGKQAILDKGKYVVVDYTPGIINFSIPCGSVVKGASHIVGYNESAIELDKKISDECIKIANNPEKCSWRKLPYQDDISALKNSSNIFQYKTAIKILGSEYKYNMTLPNNDEAFNTYRNIFKQFGLGVLTGIDLPTEDFGYVGTKTDPVLLLDFATGQYDTYTPIQLNQYINTIANGGYRMKSYLVSKINNTEIKPIVLNKVETKEEYLKRVQKGLHQVVMPGGTGSNYFDFELKGAGKTGTSQTFLDTNFDGYVDTETLSHTFSGYVPYENPIVSFTIVSPDVYKVNKQSNYRTSVNSRISKRISKKFFEIYQ